MEQPVEPKKSTKKWWIIGCLTLLIFLLCVAGIGGYFGWQFIKTVRKPAWIVGAHFDAVNQGNYRKAYDYFAESLKKELSYDDFVQLIKDNPHIYKTKSYNFSDVTIKNKVATVSGMITGKDGTVTPAVFKLVQEKGSWKIFAFRRGTEEEVEEKQE
jgi:hypothetical protein